MNTDTTALLISILLMVLIAAWVPFLDTCAGCLERRKLRRAATLVPQRPILVSDLEPASTPELDV